MEERILEYYQGDTLCRGWLAYGTEKNDKRPGIVIAPAWRGLDHFAKEKARELAQKGYIALAADIYGQGLEPRTDDEARQLMLPLFANRALLQKRIRAALDTLQTQANCDASRLGAMGFCFGGLTVIELLRSGAPIRGAVSFHGVLGNTMGSTHAQTVPLAGTIPGALLLLHGHDDPLVSAADIAHLEKEMTDAAVDWQMHIYGHTFHAFTNPQAHDKDHGLVYQPRSAKRAWQAMYNFFEEILN